MSSQYSGVLANCRKCGRTTSRLYASRHDGQCKKCVEPKKPDMDQRTYRTFIRSATSFEEYSKAEKLTQAEGLTLGEARDACQEFNSNRTEAQKEAGTKMEFEYE